MFRRFLYCLFALVVAIGATGAELRLPMDSVQMDMHCGASVEGTCPCGRPMPQRSPQPCNTAASTPVAVLARAVKTLTAVTLATDPRVAEPRPWPASWGLLSKTGTGSEMTLRTEEARPPLLASVRSARLKVIRI